MKCYSCMRKVADTTKICPHCGAKLVMDQEMFDKARTGDSDTIAALYSMAYEPMRLAANAVLHNASDAEDAAMDAVETMLQKIHQLDKPESFLPWAKQIATNKAKDYVKKKKPMLIAEAEDDEAPGFWEKLEDVDTENMPEFSMERRESSRLVRDAAKTLGKDLYAVLKCAYVDEMKLSEISEKLGVNLNTIKTRKRTAEKKMYEWAMEQEKEGIYLHGMNPIEFWLWLLRNSKGGTGFRFDPGNISKIVQGSSAATATATATKLAQEAASSGAFEKVGQFIGSLLQGTYLATADVVVTTTSRLASFIAAIVIAAIGISGGVLHKNGKLKVDTLAEALQAAADISEEDSFEESIVEVETLSQIIAESTENQESSINEESEPNSGVPASVDVVLRTEWVNEVYPEYFSVRLQRYYYEWNETTGTGESSDLTYMSDTVYLNAENGWSYTWKNMPWGKEYLDHYQYTFETNYPENVVDNGGYSYGVNDNNEYVTYWQFAVDTESPIPEESSEPEESLVLEESSVPEEIPSSVDVVFQVEWTDGKSPDHINVCLYKYRNEYNTSYSTWQPSEILYQSDIVTIGADADWSYTWSNMEWNEDFENGYYSYIASVMLNDVWDQGYDLSSSGGGFIGRVGNVFLYQDSCSLSILESFVEPDESSMAAPSTESHMDESSVPAASSETEESSMPDSSVEESSIVSETNSASDESETIHNHTIMNKTYYVRTIEATLGDDFAPYYDYWICWICGKQCLAMPEEVYDTLTIYDDNIILVSDEDGFRKHVAEEDPDHIYILEGNPSGQLKYTESGESGESVAFYTTFQRGLGYNQPGYDYEDESNNTCTECGEYVPVSEQIVTDSYFVCHICGASIPVNDDSVDLVDTDIEKHMRSAHPFYTPLGEVVEYGDIAFYEGSYERVTIAETR